MTLLALSAAIPAGVVAPTMCLGLKKLRAYTMGVGIITNIIPLWSLYNVNIYIRIAPKTLL